MDDPLLWLALIVTLSIGGFFSLAETAFTAANTIRLKVKARQSSLARKALSYIENFEQSIVVTVVGSNVISVLLSSIATILFLSAFGDRITEATLLATIVATLLFYIFCDTIPKAVARSLPNQIAMFSSAILFVFEFLFFPIIQLFLAIARLTKSVSKIELDTALTEAEFSTIVEKQIQHGTLKVEEEALIQSAIDFSELVVKDVLTPIEKIQALSEQDLHQATLPERLANATFSRLPLYRDSMHQIIGVISVRSYFQQYLKNPQFDVRKIIKKPYLVSYKITLDDLFEGFKKYRTHLAIVQDGTGKVIGMVTMEDVLEEVIGKVDETTKHTGIFHG
jgi:CBS domain containing-hemolysin-like protein